MTPFASGFPPWEPAWNLTRGLLGSSSSTPRLISFGWGHVPAAQQIGKVSRHSSAEFCSVVLSLQHMPHSLHKGPLTILSIRMCNRVSFCTVPQRAVVLCSRITVRFLTKFRSHRSEQRQTSKNNQSHSLWEHRPIIDGCSMCKAAEYGWHLARLHSAGCRQCQTSGGKRVSDSDVCLHKCKLTSHRGCVPALTVAKQLALQPAS